MLQLLLEGGESYKDLAVLLGVPEGEVRERAHAALKTLGGDQSDLTENLKDYLLNQLPGDLAEQIAADLVERPGELAQARRLHARLRLLYPAASLPILPTHAARADDGTLGEARPARTAPPRPAVSEPEGEIAAESPAAEIEPVVPAVEDTEADPPASAAPEPEPPASTEPEPSKHRPAASPTLTSQQKRLLALLSALGLAAVMVVLGISGTFDSNESGASEGAETTASTGDTELTRAVLEPQDGSEAAGVAIFGAVDEETPVLQVTAENLRPTGKGQEYSVWLDGDVPAALRLAGVEVGRDGQIATQITLPPEVLGFVVEGGFDQIDISRNRKQAYRKEESAAQRRQRPTRRIGTSVLRGPITGPGIGRPAGDQ